MQFSSFFEKKPTIPLVFIIFLAVIGFFSEQIDLYVSSYFFKENMFYLKDRKIFYMMNHIIPAILVLVSFVFLALWIFKKIDKKKMSFVFGSMLVGPLLITNAFFKNFWGRARPYEISNFSGEKNFSHAFIPSNQCSWDCSFISGHTAVAIWTLSLALIFPKKYRSFAIICSLIFTLLVATTRVVQGYHFLTDVLFAGVVNFYVVWAFYYSVYVEKKD